MKIKTLFTSLLFLLCLAGANADVPRMDIIHTKEKAKQSLAFAGNAAITPAIVF